MSKNKHFIFIRNPEESPAWGGLEKLMLDWFKEIDLNTCEVTLAVSSHWTSIFERKLKDEGISSVSVIALPYGHKEGKSLTRFFNLFFFLRSLKPSAVVYVQGWFFSFSLPEVLAGFLASHGKVYMHENLGTPNPAPKLSKRYLGVLPGVGLWWYIQLYSANLRGCLSQKVLVVSNEIKEQLISLWRYPAHKILVKYHGINLLDYVSSPEIRQKIRHSLNISLEEKVIVVASRLSKEKCIDRTINAFDLISQQMPNLTLLILGDGALLENLKSLSKNLSCARKILFTGHVDNVADYFKMSDIYVLSSDKEGFGIALIEAMATGLVCVATKCPGPNEIIQDGINGFLVEKTNEGVLTGIKKALQLSNVEIMEMSQRSRRFISDHFEIKARIKDVFAVLGIKSLEGI